MHNNMRSNYAIPVLIAAILAVSTAAPLAKFASDVHPIAIGFWRTIVVGLLLGLSVRRSQLQFSRKYWLLAAVAGLFLSLHFWAWFASLRYTSALRSTTLVCLNPIWAGILEGALLKNSPPRSFWIGVLVALFGVTLMTTGDLSEGALIGDVLALLGGLLGAAYLLVGRVARQKVDINAYGAIICLICALVMSGFALTMNVSLIGHANASWVALLLMALGPQLTGHIGLNYSVRYISASNISLVLLLEPVGAALLAALFLSEMPSAIEMLGSFFILMGVAIGAVTGTRKPTAN